MKKVSLLLIAIGAFCSSPAHAFLHHGAAGVANSPPFNDWPAEIIGLDYPNNGSSTNLTGSTIPLKIQQGAWLNSPLSYSYCWHFVGVAGCSLGTGTSVTLDIAANPSYIGQVLQVDETASNLAGSTTQTSHWIGPIINTTPVAFPTYECTSIVSGVCQGNVGQTFWSQSPGNFLENGHAIFPGCHIPPAVPPNTATTGSPLHVWYIDPAAGLTPAAQTALGVPTASQGHLGHPLDGTATVALFHAGTSGYTNQLNVSGQLFNAAAGPIVAGDTIYIEPGPIPSSLVIGAGGIFSTTTGNDGDPIIDTWIMGDPAASTPVLQQVQLANGGAGFIYKNLNFEVPRQAAILAGGSTPPVHDVQFENVSVTRWFGHSGDPWLPSHYPTSGGTSDGTVVTASPVIPNTSPQDPSLQSVCVSTCAPGTTVIPNITPIGFDYVWPQNYFRGPAQFTLNPSGLPLGTKVKLISGLNQSQYGPAGTNVTAFQASDLTGLALRGSVASFTALPQTSDTAGYWLVAASGVVAQSVDTWNTTQSYLFSPANPVAGNSFTINGVTWTFVASGATGNQFNIGANLAATLTAAAAALNADPTMSGFATYSATSSLIITSKTVGADLVSSTTVAGGVFGAWTSIGTIPPAAPTVLHQIIFATGTGHLLWWSGSAWVDQGSPNFTMGPCDPVTDAATGCPTAPYCDPNGGGCLSGSGSNVPGCDPKWSFYTGVTLTFSGGCPAGAPPAWAGTTRSITNEQWTFTDAMVDIPAGYFNMTDWGTANPVIQLTGGNNSSEAQDPTQPNVFFGATCLSVKDSVFRDNFAAIANSQTTNVVLFNNRIKFISDDAIDIYSNHRNWTIHNLYTDTTEIWGHQDFIQHGSTSTLGQREYNNADIEDEAYEVTDPTNYFLRPIQGINYTEGVSVGGYYADNVVAATTNGMNFTGSFNVVAHNVSLGKPMGLVNQRKVVGQPALNGLLVNNVAPGVDRYAIDPPTGFCASDGTTELTNVSIPFTPVGGVQGGNSQSYCPLGGGAGSIGTVAGSFVGLSGWSQTEWANNQPGISPLFIQYDPISGATYPNPGFGQYNIPFGSPCLQNSFPATSFFATSSSGVYPAPGPSTGPCPAGAGGIAALGPNASFGGTSPTTVATIIANGWQRPAVGNFPTSGTIGDTWIAQSSALCPSGFAICGGGTGAFANLTFPAGIYARTTNANGTMADYGAIGSFTLNGTGFGASQGSGSVTIAGVAVTSITSWNATQIVGISPSHTGPTVGNTVVTPNGGGSGTVTSTSIALVTSGVIPFNPGLKNQGTNLSTLSPGCGSASTASCAPYTDLLGKPWNNPPSIGAIQ